MVLKPYITSKKRGQWSTHSLTRLTIQFIKVYLLNESDDNYIYRVYSKRLTLILKDPHVDHRKVVIHVLQYIKKAPGQGLLYEDKGIIQISRYCDANWDGCPIDSDAILPGKGLVTRAMSKRLQEDWARAAEEGLRVLMNLKVDF